MAKAIIQRAEGPMKQQNNESSRKQTLVRTGGRLLLRVLPGGQEAYSWEVPDKKIFLLLALLLAFYEFIWSESIKGATHHSLLWLPHFSPNGVFELLSALACVSMAYL